MTSLTELVDMVEAKVPESCNVTAREWCDKEVVDSYNWEGNEDPVTDAYAVFLEYEDFSVAMVEGLMRKSGKVEVEIKGY